MWSLTSDHTYCILKFSIIEPAKVTGLVTYNYSRGLRGPSESRTFQSWNTLALLHT